MSRSRPRSDPLADMSRRDLLWVWLLAAVVLSPALAVGQWLAPGTGSSWIEGLVEGVLVPPLGYALLAVRRRWLGRKRAANQPNDPEPQRRPVPGGRG
jgi:hypothetical protein